MKISLAAPFIYEKEREKEIKHTVDIPAENELETA